MRWPRCWRIARWLSWQAGRDPRPAALPSGAAPRSKRWNRPGVRRQRSLRPGRRGLRSRRPAVTDTTAIAAVPLYTQLERIDRALAALGIGPGEPISPEQLFALDQWHYHGT